MKRLDRLVQKGLTRIETVKVRTAVNPLLWLTGLTLPICLALMLSLDDRSIRLGLLALAAIPVLASVVAYFVLLFRDPDRLQSEEYRIRQRALQILYRRGHSADIVDIATQRPRIEKAALPTPRDKDDGS